MVVQKVVRDFNSRDLRVDGTRQRFLQTPYGLRYTQRVDDSLIGLVLHSWGTASSEYTDDTWKQQPKQPWWPYSSISPSFCLTSAVLSLWSNAYLTCITPTHTLGKG